ncbi:Hypothetical protein EAG7_04167 [Klebsiella aerogenes]|nr:Hypothetical protein EAG7_04167 [Klebsiella aerogenes]CCG32663.1 hypothetical protein [Klebsiella aerogenes EA1509E]
MLIQMLILLLPYGSPGAGIFPEAARCALSGLPKNCRPDKA